MTAVPRHRVYADDGAGPTYANLRCLEAGLSAGRCADPPARRLADKTIPETGLDPAGVFVLKSFCVPSVLWHILALLHWRGFSMGDIGGVEYFAGEAEVTKALRRRAYDVYSYDIKYIRDLMDLCNPLGCLYALVLCLRVRSHGICWFGTVCSSWVWIARATTVRTLQTPRGDLSVPSVVQGHCQAARSCVLMVLCYCRSIVWILEQPSSSVLFTHPSMVWARARALDLQKTWHIVSTYQGAFGADTPKQKQSLRAIPSARIL